MAVPVILATIGGYLAAPFKWFWFKAEPKMKLAILVVLLILGVIGYIAYLRYQLGQAEETIIDQNLQHGLEDAGRKIEEGNEAEAEANRIRNANYANTSLTDAEKARCRAYPESEGCRK